MAFSAMYCRLFDPGHGPMSIYVYLIDEVEIEEIMDCY